MYLYWQSWAWCSPHEPTLNLAPDKNDNQDQGCPGHWCAPHPLSGMANSLEPTGGAGDPVCIQLIRYFDLAVGLRCNISCRCKWIRTGWKTGLRSGLSLWNKGDPGAGLSRTRYVLASADEVSGDVACSPWPSTWFTGWSDRIYWLICSNFEKLFYLPYIFCFPTLNIKCLSLKDHKLRFEF